MKKIFFYTTLIIVLCFMTACSQKDDDEAWTGGKLNLTKALKIKIEFADYNEQIVDGTRAITNDTLRHEVVDLGNGLSADVTVKRDTTKSKPKALTRVIPDNTYTLLAYDSSDHSLVGEVTGTVTSGVFSPSKYFDVIPNRTYDFICYNDKVTRSGNILTVTKTNADQARIGRATQFISASATRQQITFSMKPAASRIRMQLHCWTPFPSMSATLATNNGKTVPTVAQYNMSTNTWTAGLGMPSNDNLTFPDGQLENYGSDPLTESNENLFYLASTKMEDLKLTLHGSGNIYYLPLEGKSLILNGLKDAMGNPTNMQAGAAYFVIIRFTYNYLYLMSDGTIGMFNKTTFGGGTKTPIAVVVSRSQRLAVALNDAGNGAEYLWAQDATNKPFNPYGSGYSFSDMDGYNYTWETTSSRDGVTVKANNANFPAFVAAGHYQPTLPTGVTLTNGMENKKWFLPSYGHWNLFCHNLAFGETDALINFGSQIPVLMFYAPLDAAFSPVGGSRTAGIYLSSTEYYNPTYKIGTLNVFEDTWFTWFNNPSQSDYTQKGRVRPFIYY